MAGAGLGFLDLVRDVLADLRLSLRLLAHLGRSFGGIFDSGLVLRFRRRGENFGEGDGVGTGQEALVPEALSPFAVIELVSCEV